MLKDYLSKSVISIFTACLSYCVKYSNQKLELICNKYNNGLPEQTLNKGTNRLPELICDKYILTESQSNSSVNMTTDCLS